MTHRSPPSRLLRRPAALLLLCTTAPLAAQAAAVPLPTAELQAALVAKGHGHTAAAAAALAAFAADSAATSPSTAHSRIAAEGAAALALHLHARIAADDAVPAQLRALADGPLSAADPSVADQLRIHLLDHDRALGRDSAAAIARELHFVDDWWICGPFDNERGAAMRRDLPPERGFDRAASWPGKLRPVAWRRLDGMAPTGRLELAAVLRPAEQVACVLATALAAEQPTTAALHLGSAGGFVVRLDGREVARRDVDRAFAFDQDVVALPLHRGNNLLTIKFCHQETDAFAVAARLAAPAGGSAAMVHADSDPQLLVASGTTAADAAPADAAPPAAAAASHGARSLLTPDDARGIDAMWLGLLSYLRHADNESERRDRVLAARAVADLPELPEARLLLAATRMRTAKVAAEVDDNEIRADYEAVLALDPAHAEAAVDLGARLLFGTGLRRRAEELARQALRAAPDLEPARLLLADALRDAGQTQLAEREILAAAALPAASGECLRRACTIVAETDPRAARQLAHRLFDRQGDIDGRVIAIRLLLRLGDTDGATAALQRLHATEPLAPPIHELRADLAESSGDIAGALREYQDWLVLCPDDDDALAAASRLHARLGERDAQLETLRAAIECNPNRRDDQRYLEYLAAEATPFQQPFAIDIGAALATPTPPAALAAKDPVFHLLQQRIVQAHRNGTTSEYLHLCVRILTESGAQNWSDYRLPYYGGEQRARLLSCTVHKQDGGTEQPRLRGAGVALPSLRPGDTIDLDGRIDDLAPTFFGDYFGLEHLFSAADGGATLRSELVVLADPGRDYRFQLLNGAPAPQETTASDGTRTLVFRLDDLPRDEPELYRPDRRERAPLVRFSTFADWDHFAAWWWNLIRGQIETTPAMQQKVAELCKGLATQDQRIDALYRFVTTDVRYEAWEFGVHGYKPYSTAVIYERRHGDCKDKALLLCALLQQIGVRAAPVLIHADDRRSRDDLTLPMVQHFNHCIAWLPEQPDVAERFLDGTAIWHPPATIPEMDQGARVLVDDAGTALLRSVPWTDPEHNRERVRYELELQADGSVHGVRATTPLGNEAVPLRQALAVEPARRREHVERGLVPLFGQVAVGEVSCSDPLALAEPVELRVAFTATNVGQLEARRWQLPSTFGQEPLAELTAAVDRHAPLVLGVPRSEERTVAYRLPAGYRVAMLPAAVRQNQPFGSLSVDWQHHGDQVVVERKVAIALPRIEPGDYGAFRDFVAALRAADAQRIVLEREDGR